MISLTLPKKSLVFRQFPYATRPVPVQFPYSSRCEKPQFPYVIFLTETIPNQPSLLQKINARELCFFSQGELCGNCTGTVRVLYGNCIFPQVPASGHVAARNLLGRGRGWCSERLAFRNVRFALAALAFQAPRQILGIVCFRKRAC